MHKLLESQLDQSRGADGALDFEALAARITETYDAAEAEHEAASREIVRMAQEREAAEQALKDLVAQRSADLRDTRRQLRVLNRRMAAALDSTGYAVSIFDADKRLVHCNQQFLDLYHLPGRYGRHGTSFASILRARIAANSIVGDNPESYLKDRMEGVERGGFYSAVNRINTGEVVSIYHMPLADGGWVASHKDITEFSRLQDELAFRAYHDALTGLPNRYMLRERLAQCFTQAAGLGSFALLIIDLDGFKAINDTLGHAAGDQLLKLVAGRIEQATGSSGMAARMGGDEFAVVMDVGALARDAHMLAINLVEASKAPLQLEGQQAQIGFSIGVAIAPNDGTTAEALLKSADLALYAAKKERRSSYRYFEPAMGKVLHDRLELEHDLGLALERGEFELNFQPILNLTTQKFSGFEALLRWRRGGGNLVSPAEFIPVAEETGLIVPIGEWVLRQAIETASGWPSDLCVAINVSSVQFQRGNLVATVMNALGTSSLAPERVEIEITESVFFENSEANLDALRQLHALGVKIALDDFGTGFSALSYLLSYPFDKIKIDGSFVRALDNAHGAHAIVRAIAEIGHRMGMVTTAEGVETAQQLRNVHAVGYSEAQGYLIARPMSAEQVERLFVRETDAMPSDPMALSEPMARAG
jgi:diguanylate cyclase (GGDEF)-like protein